jgi:AraC-like DNA-binding protein
MSSVARVRTARDIAEWREIIGSAFGALEINARRDRPFHGRFRFQPLGNLVVAEVNSAHEDARRTRRHIAHDSEEAFAFAFTRRGSLDVSQFGRTLRVPAGSFTLLDLNSPYRLAHAEETDLVTLKVPATMLRMRIPEPQRHVLEIYPADSGIARISRDLLISIAAEGGAVPDEISGSYAARIADMFSMLVDAGGREQGAAYSLPQDMLLRRCMAIIESRLAEPGLDPAAVARAAGISLRYLHKLFSDTQTSVSEYIREQKLQKCHRELTDPARSASSIKSVAMHCGFASQAHFSKLYKKRFGVSPKSARA